MNRIYNITPTDKSAEKAARDRWNSIAKPLGSLGLLETAIEKIYTRLQEYVGQENLIEKEKCINGVNESRKITVNDLKPYCMVSTEII